MERWIKIYEILYIVHFSDFFNKILCHTCVIVSYLAFDQAPTQKPKEISQTFQKDVFTRTKNEINIMYYLQRLITI